MLSDHPYLRTTLATALLTVLITTPVLAITAGENDDFEDTTTEGWDMGVASPELNRPHNVADGGPTGAGDNYIEIVSSGTMDAPGGKMAFFNEAQWTGDYNGLGPGPVVIDADMANFGAAALDIRIVLRRTTGGTTWWVSTNAQSLATGGAWNALTFTLDAGSMTQASGSHTLSQVLDDVAMLRIISKTAVAPDGHQGDTIVATLGVDNIRITSVPVELQSFSIE